MRVFVVTRGIYDDYDVESIFSSREKAQECIDARSMLMYNEVNDRILELELDSATDPEFVGATYFLKDKSFSFHEALLLCWGNGEDMPACHDNEFTCTIPYNRDEKVMEMVTLNAYEKWRSQ